MECDYSNQETKNNAMRNLSNRPYVVAIYTFGKIVKKALERRE